MITAGATPTPKTIDQRRVALTSPQVKTLQTDNAGTLPYDRGRGRLDRGHLGFATLVRSTNQQSKVVPTNWLVGSLNLRCRRMGR